MKEKIMFLVIGIFFMLLLGTMTGELPSNSKDNKCECGWVRMRQNYSNYTIINDSNLNGIQEKVTNKLNEGWHPIGGISIVDSNSFYQAMIK